MWFILHVCYVFLLVSKKEVEDLNPWRESLLDCQVFHNKHAFSSVNGVRGNLECKRKTLIQHQQDDISHTFPQLHAFISLFLKPLIKITLKTARSVKEHLRFSTCSRSPATPWSRELISDAFLAHLASERTQFWRYLIASAVICQAIASDLKGMAHFCTALNGLCLPVCNNGKLDVGARLKRCRRVNARVPVKPVVKYAAE